MEAHNDYTRLISVCGIDDKSKNASPYVNIFYLSDEDKINEFNKFKQETLEHKISINREFAERLVDIIKYTDFDLSKDGFDDRVINIMANEAIKNKNDSSIQRIHDYVSFPAESDSKDNHTIIKNIYLKTCEIINSSDNSNLKEQLNTYFKNKDYSKLVDVAYDMKNQKYKRHMIEYFDKLLIENNYYLPNLAETIDYYEWSYCHEIARYSSLKEETTRGFVDALKNIALANKSSKSAIDRVKSLVKYNFSSGTYEELIEYLKDQVLSSK